MNNRILNHLIAVAAGAAVGVIFLAVVTQIPINEWAWWERALSIVNLSVVLGATTLILVLWQISIAKEDNAILRYSLISEFLEFLYEQEDIAIHNMRLIRLIRDYNDNQCNYRPSFAFAGNGFFERELDEKKQKLKAEATRLTQRMEKNSALVRRYLPKRSRSLLARLRFASNAVLNHDNHLRRKNDASAYFDSTGSYLRDAEEYEIEIRKMIWHLETHKHSVFKDLFPTVSS